MQTGEPLGDPPHSDLCVVGIGASAGGVAALQVFFRHVPADSGMAFVVILHLSPAYESRLAELFQQVTPMPVVQVNEPMPLVANQIYVIPPAQDLTLLDGMLQLVEPTEPRWQHAPIDLFFRALAETHGPQAAAVVLSGTGADGTMGLQRVKECGGAALVQDPTEAEFAQMPRNAIATGLVDVVLPVAELPAKLIAYWQHPATIVLPTDAQPDHESNDATLREILALLHLRTDHDFSQYKRPTLLRRIGRRMQFTGVISLAEYLVQLRDRPDESAALLRDLLISVTNFFRDPPAWDALAAAIPLLFRGRTSNDVVRAWVVGCATGEEAYTVAILLYEYAQTLQQPPSIQIFATDISDHAIAIARKGLYPETIAVDVSVERLQHFFTSEPGSYRVRKEIRDLVLFAQHNLLRDAPFSRLDLITCRNVLIYIDRAMQEQILQLFHFILRVDRLLLLGGSESTDGMPNLFTPLDKVRRLFQRHRMPSAAPKIPNLPLTNPLQRQPLSDPFRSDETPPSFDELAANVLLQHGPPSAIVNETYDIVHLARGAGRFLQFADGVPSPHLLKALHPDLRLELRAALYRAVQSGERTETRRVRLALSGSQRLVSATIQPLAEPAWARGHLLVLFHDLPDSGDTTAGQPSQAEPLAGQLEEELQRARDQLRQVTEQNDAARAEHKAGNEELQAINEELRAATEELETSKEELQSINEELQTVNQELKHKVEELSRANSDLQNLMFSTAIGTIFVDRGLRIKRFTPSAQAIVNLLPNDLNRPLAHITHTLAYDQLIADTSQVLARAASVEREVMSQEGRWYMLRLQPYRTETEQIDGVVLTFIDITQRRAAEEALRSSEERLRLLIESVQDYAILTVTPENRIAYWNTGAERMFGYSEAEIINQDAAQLFTPEDRAEGIPLREQQQALASGRAEDERWHIRKDGSRFYASEVITLIRDPNVHGFAKVMRDLTSRKQAEEALRDLLHQLVNVQNVQEAERQRIARELHDQFGQQLTGMRLGLEALTQVSGDPAQLRQRVQQLQQIRDKMDYDVDRLALELHPSVLNTLGVVAALQQHVEDWSNQHQISAEFQAVGSLPTPLALDIAIVLYRVAQEALTNILKHAAAQRVSVVLRQHSEQVQLIVEDDGKGFAYDELQERTHPRWHLGLLGMRERVTLAGGTLTIETAPQKGTTIFVRIPLPTGTMEDATNETDSDRDR